MELLGMFSFQMWLKFSFAAFNQNIPKVVHLGNPLIYWIEFI